MAAQDQKLSPVPVAAPAEVLEGYRLDEQVGFHIRRASQRHAAIFAGLMVEQLTPTQWAALTRIAAAEPISQNLLGRETAMDAATIKGVIDRLLKRHLVATAADPSDNRRTLISLTPEGREVVRKGVAAARAITAQTVEPLTPGERQLLIELLQKIS
jgi:DNA-binding MarR family transcriptional regulator